MDLARLNGVHRSTFGSSDSNTCFRTDEPRVSRPVAISTSHVGRQKGLEESLEEVWFQSSEGAKKFGFSSEHGFLMNEYRDPKCYGCSDGDIFFCIFNVKNIVYC